MRKLVEHEFRTQEAMIDDAIDNMIKAVETDDSGFCDTDGSAPAVTTNDFGYQKVSARWILQLFFTGEEKQ